MRMLAHSENALNLAKWLESRPWVTRVYYPGLPSHPQYELALRRQSAGGGIVSFEVDDGRKGAWKLIGSTRLLSITANPGDVKDALNERSPAGTNLS